MKKIISLVLIMFFIFSLAACGQKGEETVYEGTGNSNSSKAKDMSDVDLSVMNNTMATAKFTDIMNNPDDYIGRKIKMYGTYTTLSNQDKTKSYSSCAIKDNTGCCAIGELEFVLKEGLETPKENEMITIEGVLNYYEEDGGKFMHLEDTELF